MVVRIANRRRLLPLSNILSHVLMTLRAGHVHTHQIKRRGVGVALLRVPLQIGGHFLEILA